MAQFLKSKHKDSYLAARGLKTLGLRMARHCASANIIAHWLDSRDDVTRVYYPGLESHPGHALAASQQRDFGGIVSLQLADEAAARAFAESMEYFQLPVSLGGVESLVCYPREMTHALLNGTPLEIPANLVHLAVGTEEVEDLQADLERGLAAVGKASKAGGAQRKKIGARLTAGIWTNHIRCR